jgi:hypothetical protein
MAGPQSCAVNPNVVRMRSISGQSRFASNAADSVMTLTRCARFIGSPSPGSRFGAQIVCERRILLCAPASRRGIS